MPKYIVTFFKHVPNSYGHSFKAPQEKIRISAAGPEQAIEAAKRRFASMRGMPDWRYHADAVEVIVDVSRRRPPADSRSQPL